MKETIIFKKSFYKTKISNAHLLETVRSKISIYARRRIKCITL